MVNQQNVEGAIQLTIYLTSLLIELIKWGYDPRPGLSVIHAVLHKNIIIAEPYLNVILIILSQTLHTISPVYISDLTRLLRFIIETSGGGNTISMYMIVEGLIMWVANPSLIGCDGLSDAQALIKYVTTNKQTSKCCSAMSVRYYHPAIALSFDLAKLSERIVQQMDEGKYGCLQNFVQNLKPTNQNQFCETINLFLRGLFLCDSMPTDVSIDLIAILMRVVKNNETVAIDFIFPWLYKLSREQTPEIQLELLRGLSHFAVVKVTISDFFFNYTINKISFVGKHSNYSEYI